MERARKLTWKLGDAADKQNKPFRMQITRLHFPLFAFSLLLLLTGCLPSSCQRTQPTDLFPADSVSREIAGRTAVDTLQHIEQTNGPDDHPLAYPRTVRFGSDRQIYVSDVERNSVLIFDRQGQFTQEIRREEFSYPYLAGLRGDTLLVFNPEAGRMDFVLGREVVRRVELPEADQGRDVLHYAAATDRALYYKRVEAGAEGVLLRVDNGGSTVDRHRLTGPYWRHAGLLRPWGDSLLSLSGYRPVVDVLSPGGALDTMALTGFDSPMLARSRAFATGDADQPPLLTASAAPSGGYLFTLNMRPGWLRIDVYDRSGRLQHVLTEDNPAADTDFYPVDLDVQQAPDGAYEIAVVSLKPTPLLALYRWSTAPDDDRP